MTMRSRTVPLRPLRIPVSALFLLLLVAACASPEPETPPPEMVGGGPRSGGPEGPRPELDLPLPEDTRSRTERLLRLEQGCDQWYAAFLHQEFARMESLQHLLRSYTRENFDQIVSDLRHGSPRYRRVMAAALGFSARPEAVGPLMEALKDQYYEVVLHSLLSLYHLADSEAFAPASGQDEAPKIVIDPESIVPYLQHPKAEVRSNAALVLTRIVHPAVPKSVVLALIGATEDRDAATRVHAVGALGATKDPESFSHLVKALSDDVELVRIRAALSLGLLGKSEAVPYLIEVLEREHEKREVKKAAAKSLSSLLGEPERLTHDPEFWRGKAKEKAGT